MRSAFGYPVEIRGFRPALSVEGLPAWLEQSRYSADRHRLPFLMVMTGLTRCEHRTARPVAVVRTCSRPSGEGRPIDMLLEGMGRAQQGGVVEVPSD